MLWLAAAHRISTEFLANHNKIRTPAEFQLQTLSLRPAEHESCDHQSWQGTPTYRQLCVCQMTIDRRVEYADMKRR